MKKSLTLGIVAAMALAFSLTGCNNTTGTTAQAPTATSDSIAVAGSIVYFNLDKVMSGYDMANDLRSVLETKVGSIQSEIDRRGKKLDKDVKDFQDKIDKGLLTRSVAEVQQQKLQQQQQQYQQYAMQKQQEIAEEQQVTLNQIANAIIEFVLKFNADKKYALILTTTGDILPTPVVTGDPTLDITDELLKGLNDEYVKTKSATE